MTRLERDRTRLVRPGRGGVGGGGVQVQQMLVTQVQDDYLVCRTWNGTDEGATDINVARPPLQRRTRFDGKTRLGIDYTYTTPVDRVGQAGAVQETQLLIGRYALGRATDQDETRDIIYAIGPIQGGTSVTVDGDPVTWLQLNIDGRAMAAEFVPS